MVAAWINRAETSLEGADDACWGNATLLEEGLKSGGKTDAQEQVH
jgi:hypothetical protein